MGPTRAQPKPQQLARERPLVWSDTHGRAHDYLRISITDRCNLRCRYCMPAEGLEWLPRDEILSFEETTRLAGIFYDRGVRKIRFTGGEPTLRRDVPELVRMVHERCPEASLHMTTNALRLGELAAELRTAGLTGLNISLDTLDPETFREMARRDRFEQTWAGVGPRVRRSVPRVHALRPAERAANRIRLGRRNPPDDRSLGVYA
ncbi:MAG: radical SAM protein [Gemmatimonadota bacterium]